MPHVIAEPCVNVKDKACVDVCPVDCIHGGDDDPQLFTALSFTVPDIEATHQRLKAAGVEFTQPPTKMDWGGTLAYLKDPEGHVIGLVAEMIS